MNFEILESLLYASISVNVVLVIMVWILQSGEDDKNMNEVI